MTTIKPYSAFALQTVCDAVNQDEHAEASHDRIKASLDRIGQEIRATAGWTNLFLGLAPRLAVLPEYVLTGFPMREGVQDWRAKAAFEPDSFVHKALADIAAANNLYLAANLYERNEIAPEMYFQANLLFGPDRVLHYRYLRTISITTPSSFDYWDRYVEKVGIENVFPVADTEIGRIGPVASEEILFPEIARALAMNGAEVLAHSTSEVASPSLTPKDIAKRARAIENSVYVVSANTAGIMGTAMPSASADGMSKIISPDGKVLADADTGPSMNAASVIDIGALRAKRARPAMTNLLMRVPGKAFAPIYEAAPTMQPNGLEGRGRLDDRGWFRERLADIGARFAAHQTRTKED